MDPRVAPLKKDLRGIISSGRLDGLPVKDLRNAEFVKQKIVELITKLDTYEARKKDEPVAIVEPESDDEPTLISTPIPDLQSTNRSSNQTETTNEATNLNSSSGSVESIKSSASSMAAAKEVVEDLRAGKKRKLSKYGENDLQMAAKKGNFELVKSLLELQGKVFKSKFLPFI